MNVSSMRLNQRRSAARLRQVFCLMLCLPLGIYVGCGGDGPVLYDVSGTVSLDGVPIPKGEIIFNPVGGRGRADATKIIDGKFTIKVSDGQKQIKINAASTDPKLIGKRKVNPDFPVPVNYIPQKYNRKSELEKTVEARNGQAFEFILER